MKKKDYLQLTKQIYQEHVSYWADKKEEMRNYSDVYSLDFWRRLKSDVSDMIQVSDARAYVEAYISSLFSKAPSVRIGEDIKATEGKEAVAEAVVNRFLDQQEEAITNACRLALIFPCAFFKIAPTGSDELLEALSLSVLKPWDVVVDRQSKDWHSQRWLGCVTSITVSEAKELYGDKQYTPVMDIDFLSKNTKKTKGSTVTVPEDYQFVVIVELYDLVNHKRILYTPNLRTGEILKEEDIPVVNGSPLVPIIPLYMNMNPQAPLEGFSYIKTIYDPIKEKNLLRTHWAQSIRRDARQYVYQEGVLDEEALARLELGGDNTFVPVKGQPAGTIIPLQTIPMSTNHQIYHQQIEQDLQKANLMASFTRGQSTNVTATEITALAQYTASEVGKLARIRDGAVEAIAATYLSMLSSYVEEQEAVTIIVDYKPHMLKASDLEGRLRIQAVDGGALPIQQSAKKQEFNSIFPVLLQLGVDKQKILEHIAELYELPLDLIKLPEVPPQPPAQPGSEASIEKLDNSAQVPLPLGLGGK